MSGLVFVPNRRFFCRLMLGKPSFADIVRCVELRRNSLFEDVAKWRHRNSTLGPFKMAWRLETYDKNAFPLLWQSKIKCIENSPIHAITQITEHFHLSLI